MTNNLATLFSAELEGIDARTIEIEVDLNVGLHAFNIVGLVDRALSEAKERVNSALKNAGMKPPNRENRKITVNLAPADVRKTGSQYDLAIALGYLVATKQIPRFETNDKIFLGELALDGRVRRISGALNIAEMAARRGFKKIFLPRANANEASVVRNIEVIAIENLKEVIAILSGALVAQKLDPATPKKDRNDRSNAVLNVPDLADIRGQENAKRALIIAAAGHHNLIFVGPPGVGKSLLAQALPGILPPLGLEEAIEVTKIWSSAGRPLTNLVISRPFRAPHQTASAMAVLGGGSEPRPGEVSLAHNGVLFLDELPEFPRNILEALRGPMESGVVHVARAKGRVSFPARFSLIAAMNPCPCGFYGDAKQPCRCGTGEIIRYQKKISGPLLDRIDLQVKVPRVAVEELRKPGMARERGVGAKTGAETKNSAAAKKAIEVARARQTERFKGVRPGLRVNADMTSREVETLVHLSPGAEEFLDGLEHLAARASKSNAGAAISPRSYYRLLKTARTIADLENKEEVGAEELAEAWSYRLREELPGTNGY